MNQQKKDSSNKPVKRIQLRGITASVFKNLSDNGVPFYKVSVTRTFKDGDDYKTTTAFNRDDLPSVWEVARGAWLEVIRLESESSKKDDEH